MTAHGTTPTPTGAGRSRWRRLWRHLWRDARHTRRRLDDAACARLAAAIRTSESGHLGEIRLSVEAALPPGYVWQRLTARDRALTLFGKLRVWDTEHDTGVLVYVLLAESAIEIVADRGLRRRVPPTEWDAIVEAMAARLSTGADGRPGALEPALHEAVQRLDALLQRHWPLPDGLAANPDELANVVDRR
ncbi:MAG: hypothetical protein RL223_4541 [Pseudomonadota bacterium]|jgi:uncharacterized membrane protein